MTVEVNQQILESGHPIGPDFGPCRRCVWENRPSNVPPCPLKEYETLTKTAGQMAKRGLRVYDDPNRHMELRALTTRKHPIRDFVAICFEKLGDSQLRPFGSRTFRITNPN